MYIYIIPFFKTFILPKRKKYEKILIYISSDGVHVKIWINNSDNDILFDDVFHSKDKKTLRFNLDKYAGQEITLHLASSSIKDTSFDYLFLAEPIIYVPQENPERIILVFIDTLRADTMGMYGYTRPTTPRLNAWSENAAVFTQARSIAPWTLPSARTMVTGYVPEKLKCLNGKAMSERRIDVGYRARKCPFWLGRKSHEKYLIGKLFAEKSQGSGLVCDISSSEKDRIYGSRWTDFILNCKTTLGTESGASIIDFTGRIEYDLNRYQAFRPFAKFEKVPSRYLEKEGEIELQVISPRCFEAAALGTVMVMYPGTYSGILQPGVHFLPLEKDFSNIDEVVGFIQDDGKLEEIARNAKRDLVNSGRFSFESFIGEFDDSLDLIAKEKRWVPISKTVSLEEALSSNTIKVRNSKPRKGNPIMKAIRGLWRNSPPWIRFLVIVTFMKKSYYAHLFALKDKYRT